MLKKGILSNLGSNSSTFFLLFMILLLLENLMLLKNSTVKLPKFKLKVNSLQWELLNCHMLLKEVIFWIGNEISSVRWFFYHDKNPNQCLCLPNSFIMRALQASRPYSPLFPSEEIGDVSVSSSSPSDSNQSQLSQSGKRNQLCRRRYFPPGKIFFLQLWLM